MKLAGYLVASAVLAACAGLLAWRSGLPLGEVAPAAGTAVVLQAAATVPLIRRLDHGLNATVPWVFGMSLRFLAIAAAWVLSAAGAMGRDAATVFGLTLAALIVLEAFWLAAATTGRDTHDKLRK